jgi:hypothetical protein
MDKYVPIVAAVIAVSGAIAAVVVARHFSWIPKTDPVKKVYQVISEAVFDVRSSAASIRTLLGNGSSDDFGEQIIRAGKKFHQANDHLDYHADSSRPILEKEVFKSIKYLIDASAELIEELQTGTGGHASADEIFKRLDAAGKSFWEQLELTEDLIEEEIKKLT